MNRTPKRFALIGGIAVLAALTAGGVALAGEDRPPTRASVSVDGSITPAQAPGREDCPGDGGGADQGGADQGGAGTPAVGL